jgi:hypothetical protein
MTTQSTQSFTFHKVREQSERGDPAAWRAFLNFYTPLGLHLLRMYLPTGGPEPGRVWEQTVVALAENDFERLRATDKKSERQFLAEVRALLLDQTLLASPSGSTGSLNLESLGKLLEGLPLLHQEMLSLKLAGYTDGSIERMLRVAPRVAQEALARLEADYADALKSETDRCAWPFSWLALLQQARAQKQESCPQLYQFLRIHDGQVSWYDKEPIEKHVAVCRHCLEVWLGLREVAYWRKAATAVPAEQTEGYLRVLPLAPPVKKSLFQRMFG